MNTSKAGVSKHDDIPTRARGHRLLCSVLPPEHKVVHRAFRASPILSRQDLLPRGPTMSMKKSDADAGIDRILLTGAAGALGGVVRAGLAGSYGLVRCTDIVEMEPPGDREETIVADLADLAEVRELTLGIDAIVHLGGETSDTTWDRIHNANILGAANLFGTASTNGVKRIIFASSNHVVGFHANSLRIDNSATVRPDTIYGASKAFGEAIAHVYAAKTDMRVLCIRIGTCTERPHDVRSLSTWLSYGDLMRLVRVGLNADYQFETIYGVSANTRSLWDDPIASRLGYQPVDDAERYAGTVTQMADGDDAFHGGEFIRAPIAGPR